MFDNSIVMKSLREIQEKNKHFTPDISDIRVGYEYAIFDVNGVYSFTTTVKNPHKLLQLVDWMQTNKGEYVEHYIKNSVKVPYLTREQIESEKWKCIDEINSHYEKDGYIMIFYLTSHRIQVVKPMTSYGRPVIYEGNCPSVNELRYITKLLGINQENAARKNKQKNKL